MLSPNQLPAQIEQVIDSRRTCPMSGQVPNL